MRQCFSSIACLETGSLSLSKTLLVCVCVYVCVTFLDFLLHLRLPALHDQCTNPFGDNTSARSESQALFFSYFIRRLLFLHAAARFCCCNQRPCIATHLVLIEFNFYPLGLACLSDARARPLGSFHLFFHLLHRGSCVSVRLIGCISPTCSNAACYYL